MTIKWYGSPNFTKGRTKPIDTIVIHWIVGKLYHADSQFADPKSKSSATYGVGETEIHQYVSENDTHWANGHKDPAKNYNPRSIAIEVEGGWLLPDGSRSKPSFVVHENAAWLIANIVKRIPNIKLDRTGVKKHNEVSDTGTECPGSTDIDFLISRAKEILNGGVFMDYELIVRHVYQQATGGLPSQEVIKQKVDFLKGTQNLQQLMDDVIKAGNHYYHVERMIRDLYRGVRQSEISPELAKEKVEFVAGGGSFAQLVKEVAPEVCSSEPADPALKDKAERYDMIVNALRG